MEAKQVVAALGALAQETRLAIFRLLVERGPDGLAAGTLADRLAVPASSLSFHLAQLAHAGLVTQRRDGRSLIYAADFTAMNDLMGFLTANCCGGGMSCGPVCAPAADIVSAAPSPKRVSS
jgi:DNA-binding transcriptional ArsR family regulator